MENSPPQNTNKPDGVATGVAVWLMWLFIAWGFLLFLLWGDDVSLAYMQEAPLPGVAAYTQGNAVYIFGGLLAAFAVAAAAALTGRTNNGRETRMLKGYVLAAGGLLSVLQFPYEMFSAWPPYSGVFCGALWCAFFACAITGSRILVPLRSHSSDQWGRFVFFVVAVFIAAFLWYVFSEAPL